MAYTINKYNGATLTVVEDGTLDTNTDLKLVGKNYAGYGEVQNENFVFLLENFANPNPPPRRITGQLWYDSRNAKLKFYDGNNWRTTGGAEVGPNEPTGLSEGDFWWNSDNQQLYAWNGSDFVLVGPQDAGEGLTQMRSISVLGTDNLTRSVIASTINDQVVAIFSNEEFNILQSPQNSISGFTGIKKGITLVNTPVTGSNEGITTDNFFFWGTASNSLRLGGKTADEFVLKDGTAFEGLTDFPKEGIRIGDALKIYIENDTEGVIENELGRLIKFRTQDARGNVANNLQIEEYKILPGRDLTGNLEEITLGDSSNSFVSVYADNFFGVSEQAQSLIVNGEKKFGDVSKTANSIAVRDNSGDLSANLFKGTALSAKYADLAEVYTTETKYPTGTVVGICQHVEHEACTSAENVIGVVSEFPAYLMNAEQDGQPIALKGRVPVRIVGSVRKGDNIYSNYDGTAGSTKTDLLVGIALESKEESDEKLIECYLQV